MSNILIVEDHQNLRKVIRDEIMRRLGHQCTEASNHREAMALIHDQPRHLVLCDISLPDGNGLELLGHIKSSAPETKVIIMSAIQDRETVSGTLKLGASAFLAKPFQLSDLITLIERTLSEQRAAA